VFTLSSGTRRGEMLCETCGVDTRLIFNTILIKLLQETVHNIGESISKRGEKNSSRVEQLYAFLMNY
jgi:hypothetical protein